MSNIQGLRNQRDIFSAILKTTSEQIKVARDNVRFLKDLHVKGEQGDFENLEQQMQSEININTALGQLHGFEHKYDVTTKQIARIENTIRQLQGLYDD